MAPKNINSPPAAPSQGPLAPLQLRPCPAAALFEPKKIGRSSQPNEQKQKMAQKALPANPVRNKLAESENRPLNQTFTIAKQKPSPVPFRRNRANSFDSDFADFGPEVIFGFISRKCNVKNGGSMKMKAEKTCFALGWAPKDKNGCSGTKLPSLDGFMPDRTCCQLQFTRSNFELVKYKRNLKN